MTQTTQIICFQQETLQIRPSPIQGVVVQRKPIQIHNQGRKQLMSSVLENLRGGCVLAGINNVLEAIATSALSSTAPTPVNEAP